MDWLAVNLSSWLVVVLVAVTSGQIYDNTTDVGPVDAMEEQDVYKNWIVFTTAHGECPSLLLSPELAC